MTYVGRPGLQRQLPDPVTQRRRSRTNSSTSWRPPVGLVRLEPDLRDALQARADQEGRTSSELIRDALHRHPVGTRPARSPLKERSQ
jgi:hypothetical protein